MSDDDRKSAFNAGIAMTERIDAMQRAINMSRFNPVGMNVEIGRFNYEIILSAIDSLVQEAWAKMSVKEREEIERISKTIKNFLEYNNIICNSNGEIRLHQQNFKKLMELIDIYEKNIKICLDKHNLNAPDSDDDEGL